MLFMLFTLALVWTRFLKTDDTSFYNLYLASFIELFMELIIYYKWLL